MAKRHGTVENGSETMKILVIDDEAAVRYAITRILEKNGYEVATAADGVRGMSQFHAWHPDLVITDLIMPEQEGMQTIKQLRQADPAVKILAISGGGRIVNVDFLQVARRIGADEILAKPFDSRELLSMVRRLLPASGTAASAPLDGPATTNVR
jgi:DNA-binding response OmpR family regulator